MIATTPNTVATDDYSLGHFGYFLMLAFPLFLLPPIISLIVIREQKNNKMNKLLYSHIKWQRWSIISMLLLLVCGWFFKQSWLGISLLVVAPLWFCSRIIKGWLTLVDGQAI